ncbi:MAG: PatB family C-S lyase [Gammaproteobacteria bacterium]|nr:PatB family C-S lyase [Gammaproteobacteria bacterium]
MPEDFNQVIDRKNTASLKWDKYRNTDILPMWVADMEFPVAEAIQNALKKRIEHPIYGYTIGTAETAAIVCQRLREDYGWEVDPDWLVWIPGVVPGLWAACAAAGRDGDQAIFSTPIYHHFFAVPGQARKVARPVPLRRETSGRWTYDFDALEAAINDKTSHMLLCSPHNPTGTLFSREETRRLCRLCDEHDLLIVSDEIHCGLILAEDKPHCPAATASPESAARLITLMSPSKTFNLAGLNCSFAVIADAQLRKQFNDACHSVLPMVPGLAYTALEAAYSDGGEWHRQLLTQLRDNHAYLEREISTIPGLTMSPMEATYLAWINTDDLPVDDAAAFFEQHGVGLSPGAGFGLANYVRLNFACSRAMLETAVERMRKAVASL